MTGPTAIQTRYKGYHFRSRLEARWAVFFDAMGVTWEYEPQGFSLPSGAYLPDFYFPTWSAWGEVKPNEEAYNRRQLVELAEATGKRVIMLDGTPDLVLYKVVIPSAVDERGTAIPVAVEHVHLSMSAARDQVWIEFEPNDPAPASRQMGNAVDAARSARFEHGESPIIPLPPRPPKQMENPAEAELAAHTERIDRLIPLTDGEERDALVREKMDLMRELRRLGSRRFVWP